MTKWTSLKDRLTSSKEGALLWNQERSILDTTDLVCDVMDEAGVTRSELAARLGKTKGYITQLLDGSANMTIRTIADVFLVLGHEFVPTIRPASSGTGIKLQMSFPFSANQFEDDSDGWILKFPETKTERPLHHVQKA